MPRYFLDVRVGMVGSRDQTGVSLHDGGQASREALRRAAEFASFIRNLEEANPVVVTARDNSGAAVLKVRLVCHMETA